MESCLYLGHVAHRRHAPRRRQFRYSLFQVYLDLGELDRVFDGIRLASVGRPNLAWLRRADHLGDPAAPLDVAVRDLVAARTGRRPRGPIRLLTHLRYFGYVMNPVSLYYCFEPDGRTLATIVAEIHNTPWGERHCYVLDESQDIGRGDEKRYRFGKEFHVSPFLPMDLSYDWRFTVPGERLVVRMANLEPAGGAARGSGGGRAGQVLFDATLSLRRRPLSAARLYRAMLAYPFMTGKVVAAIYLQALGLWLGRVPFHQHPSPEKRWKP